MRNQIWNHIWRTVCHCIWRTMPNYIWAEMWDCVWNGIWKWVHYYRRRKMWNSIYDSVWGRMFHNQWTGKNVYTNTRLQILQSYCNYSIIFKISAILLQFDQNFVLGNYQINSMIITCIYLLRFVIQLTKDNAPQSMKKYVKHNINRNILNSVPQHMKKNVQLLMNRWKYLEIKVNLWGHYVL